MSETKKEIQLEENKLKASYSNKNLQMFEEKKHPQLINWYEVVKEKKDSDRDFNKDFSKNSVNAEESVEVHVRIKGGCCRIC
jgi:hypothetical protein